MPLEGCAPTIGVLDDAEARRELLAEAANRFLDSLLVGTVPEAVVETEATSILDRVVVASPGGGASRSAGRPCV